jgi:hypothetical protein
MESITESGKDIKQAEGVKAVGLQDGNALFKVVSGTYSFRTPCAKQTH